MNGSPNLRAIIALLFSGIFLGSWIFYIEPLADKDAVLQLYFPLLNYLKGAEIAGLEHQFLVEEFFSDAYPDGLAIFGWVISFCGLGPLVLEEPYWFPLFLFFPVAVSLYVFPLSRRGFGLFFLIFFLPAVQISLKGFSPHAFNVFYSFAGILCYLKYYRRSRIEWLAAALLFFWLSMIFKHMGVVHYGSFLAAHLLWQISGRARPRFENLILWLLPISALPLYPLENSAQYFQTTFSHSPNLSMRSLSLGLVLLVFIISIAVFILIRLKRRRQELGTGKEVCRWFGSSFLVWLILFLPFWLWTEPSSERISLWLGLLVLLVGYSLILWVLYYYPTPSIRGFFILLCLLLLTHHTALYISWLAKSSYLFFLPQIMIVWTWFLHRPRPGRVFLCFGLVLLISNFFPSLGVLEGDPKLKKFASIYFEGFKSIHQNPLGWERSKVRRLRHQLVQVLEKVNLENGSLAIAQNLHFHTRLSLAFPKNILYGFGEIHYLDDLGVDRARKWMEEWRVHQEGLLARFVQNGEIPIIFRGEDPFTTRERENFTLEYVLSREEFHPNQFLQALGAKYVEFLENEDRGSEFYQRIHLQDSPGLEVWVHRSLRESMKRAPSWELWNREQTREEEAEDKPESRAAQLFLQSNHYFEKDPRRCLELLEQALELDPSHPGALEDRSLIMERLKRESGQRD